MNVQRPGDQSIFAEVQHNGKEWKVLLEKTTAMWLMSSAMVLQRSGEPGGYYISERNPLGMSTGWPTF